MRAALPAGRQAAWVALLFALFTIWVRPGPTTLYGVDAGCYARVAAQMAALPLSRWVDVRLGEDAFFEHPPGFVWLEAAAFRIGGESTRTAVLLARCLATCVLGLTLWLARSVAGERAMLGCALVLPAMSSFLYESQNPMLEMPLCAGLLLAMLGAWRLRTATRTGVLFFALGSVAAFWVKGPPALAAGGWLAWMGLRRRVSARQVALAAAAALTLGLVSVAAFEWQRTRLGLPPFFTTYMHHQVVTSALHGRHNPQGSPWYYLPVIWRWHATGVVLGLPALLVLRRRAAGHTPARQLAEMGLVWGVVWVVAFSIMRQKYQWYMHPLTPAFAWIIGAGVADLQVPREHWQRIGLRLQWSLPLIYGAMLAWYPQSFRTPHATLDAIHAAPRPMFAPGDARRVAYCGPSLWREEHVARFLWRADLAPCEAAAPFRFDGTTLQRLRKTL